MSILQRTTLALGCTGFLLAGLTMLHSQTPGTVPAQSSAEKEIAALKADIEILKGKVPDQSHAMKDVAYHFANLWFAGQKKNWPLAKFYLDETRAHLKWAVRIIPVRKISTGDFDLRVMLEGLDQTAFTQVQTAVTAGDAAQFETTYKAATAACMSCHIASEKPFLRLRVPEEPEARLIDFTVP